MTQNEQRMYDMLAKRYPTLAKSLKAQRLPDHRALAVLMDHDATARPKAPKASDEV